MSERRQTMDDSKFYRMAREEKRRWLKSRGDAGGSLTEFTAHLTKLIQIDKSWSDAAREQFVASLGRNGLPPKQRPIRESDNTTQVHADFVAVRDLLHHARFTSRQAKTKAERAEADRPMDAAHVAKERAGGDLEMKLRDIKDQVWPASETRQ
jgi:hypothetical protein